MNQIQKLSAHPAFKVLIGLCIYNFVAYGVLMNTFGQYQIPIIETLGISRTLYSSVTTARGILGALITNVAARLLPRVNTKIYYLVMSLGLAACYFGQSLINSYSMLLVINILMGVVYGLGVYSTMQVITAQWFLNPAKYLGIATMMNGLGSGLFSPIMGFMIQNYSWRFAMRVQSLIVILLMVPVSLFLIRYSPKEIGAQQFDDSPEKTAAAKAAAPQGEASGFTFKEAIKHPVFFLMIVFAICSSLLSGVMFHVPAALTGKGFTILMVGSVTAFFQWGMTFGQFFMGQADARIGVGKTTALYAVLVLISCGILIVINQPIVWILALAVFMLGMGRAYTTVQCAVLSKSVFGMKEYSKLFSIPYTVTIMLSAVSATLMGYLYDLTQSYNGVFTVIGVSTVIACIAAIAAISLSPYSKKKPSEAKIDG